MGRARDVLHIYEGEPIPRTESNRWVSWEHHEAQLAEARRQGAMEACQFITEFLSGTYHEPLTSSWWEGLAEIRAQYEQKTGE